MVWSDVHFSRDRYCVAFFAKDKQSFVDRSPQQPAAESAFTSKPSRKTRGGNKAVFYSIIGSFFGAKHASCYEVEQAATATEPSSEYSWAFFQSTYDRRVTGHLFRSPI
jgi:hypothetical protein